MRRRQCDNSCAGWLILWIFAGSVCSCISQQVSRVDLYVGSNMDPDKYPGQVANFGNQAVHATNLNLILPPANQSHLCEFPEELDQSLRGGNATNKINETSFLMMEEDEHRIDREEMNVALFVSYGECLPMQKAQVALSLQRNFTRYGTVTHLIIYNNDLNHMDELHTLTSYLNEEDVSDISIIFVSTRTGRDIMKNIDNEERRQRVANPRFYEDGNEFWYLPVSFLELPDHQPSGGGGVDYTDIGPYVDTYDNTQYPPQIKQDNGMPTAEDFYWFRLVIFSLLVVSPCFRAAYLWYAGGARIRLRYNDQGRVVGLQYIPPMPFWFAPRQDDNYAQPATRMTREQVLALPEIAYEPNAMEDIEQQQPAPDKSESRGNDKNGGNDASSDTDDTTTIDVNESSTITGSGSDSSRNTTPMASTFEAASNSSDIDEEQGPPESPSELHSTCSICIDDFEEGERLRMLPRCRHIFHTDCILPWLTERQGCCPLCKTEVIEPEDEETSEDQQRQHSQDASNHDTPEQPLGPTNSPPNREH